MKLADFGFTEPFTAEAITEPPGCATASWDEDGGLVVTAFQSCFVRAVQLWDSSDPPKAIGQPVYVPTRALLDRNSLHCGGVQIS